METLEITETVNTPYVSLNHTSGILEFKGKSIPENTIKFYGPVKHWIETYSGSPQPNTHLIIYLEYFNTSSAKIIIEMLKKMVALNNDGKTKLQVTWRYDANDTDMLEAGEDMSNLVKHSFTLESVED
jgi:hypothetical protein